MRARPSRSLARTVIGVLTLAARPWVATPYARVNVPPRSRPARALGPSGGFWDGGQKKRSHCRSCIRIVRGSTWASASTTWRWTGPGSSSQRSVRTRIPRAEVPRTGPAEGATWSFPEWGTRGYIRHSLLPAPKVLLRKSTSRSRREERAVQARGTDRVRWPCQRASVALRKRCLKQGHANRFYRTHLPRTAFANRRA